MEEFGHTCSMPQLLSLERHQGFKNSSTTYHAWITLLFVLQISVPSFSNYSWKRCSFFDTPHRHFHAILPKKMTTNHDVPTSQGPISKWAPLTRAFVTASNHFSITLSWSRSKWSVQRQCTSHRYYIGNAWSLLRHYIGIT